MILAAGLLVLVGLGLFVAGLATGTTLLYWATVAVCALAAVLLVLSRRGMSAAPAEREAAPVKAPRKEAASRKTTATREMPAAKADEENGEQPAAEDSDEPAAEPEPVAGAPSEAAVAMPVEEGEPPVEEVEVTDLLLVVDLTDDVFVLDEHPRYHLAECPRLVGHEAIPLPLDEARTDGFTPCGICSPDRTMAERERARRTGRPTS